jgi:hypothetical protein
MNRLLPLVRDGDRRKNIGEAFRWAVRDGANSEPLNTGRQDRNHFSGNALGIAGQISGDKGISQQLPRKLLVSSVRPFLHRWRQQLEREWEKEWQETLRRP